MLCAKCVKLTLGCTFHTLAEGKTKTWFGIKAWCNVTKGLALQDWAKDGLLGGLLTSPTLVNRGLYIGSFIKEPWKKKTVLVSKRQYKVTQKQAP